MKKLLLPAICLLTGLGSIAQKNNYSAAINDFDSTIRINPRFALAYINKSKAEASMNKINEAVADSDSVIALKNNPNLFLAYNNKAFLLANSVGPNVQISFKEEPINPHA